MGLMTTDYGELQARDQLLSHVEVHLGTGNGFSFPAGRLSYQLGLQEPSLVVSTSCSSSLVAVHLACQSLRQGECHTALAAGVSLMLSPN
jgi:acyl transferase domain-containing protein